MGEPSWHGRRVTYLAWAAVVATALSAVVAAYLFAAQSRTLRALCREDGIVENLTAAMYFAAAAAFVYTCAAHRFCNVFHWGYAALFFVVAGEEISWGQRLFQIATPDPLRAINVQQELNLHNVQGLHSNVRWMALLVVLTIAVAMPLAERFVPRLRALARRLGVPVFPLRATPIVLIAIAVMAGTRLLGVRWFGSDELAEFYLALAFMIFGLRHLAAHRAAQANAKAAVAASDDHLQGAGDEDENELLALR